MESKGLTTIEAQKRIKQFGYNEVVANQLDIVWFWIKKILLNPMGLMLLSLSVLYWFLGNKIDAIFLLIAFFPVTFVEVLLQSKSRAALKALRETLTPTAKLIRDGKIKSVKIRYIVPGDILVFEEGQALPADGIILEADYLNVSEAALTGESVPIMKKKNDIFYGGTTILAGKGLGLIQQTGKSSKYGEIALLVQNIKETKSPLQHTVDKLIKVIALIAVIFMATLFIFEWSSTHQLIPSLILMFTLGIATVPEEFPLVLTLYLSLGAWRLSKKNILVKSLPSVEALGRVDVICVDKTGTLTEGIFQLEEIKKIDSSIDDNELWQLALMACEIHAVDAMEIAIFKKGEKFKPLLKSWELIYDYPFEPETKHMSHVWQNKDSGEFVIAMKGAVEGVIEYCQLDSKLKAQINEMTSFFASQGKRILGMAARYKKCVGERKADEKELNFIGFMVFNDPIRPSVKQAVLECRKAGIEIKMLTGDHLLTAQSVAKEIGLNYSTDLIFTGKKLASMHQNERKEAYIKGAIFARVLPEQKYEMIKVLKEQGHITAMTGDGINDVAALKLADIGVSMGEGATDIARHSAKMVLMKSDFLGIVAAVFEGRQIFANLYRSFSYLISFHIPIILLTLIPSILKWPSILLPIHIILLEMVVDPVSSFTFENIKNPNLEKKPQKSIISKRQCIYAVINGILLSCGALLAFIFMMDKSPPEARSLAIAIILLGNIFLVLINIFPVLNRRFYITIFILFLAAFLLTTTGFFEKYLHLEQLNFSWFLMALAIAAIACAPGLLQRLFFNKRNLL